MCVHQGVLTPFDNLSGFERRVHSRPAEVAAPSDSNPSTSGWASRRACMQSERASEHGNCKLSMRMHWLGMEPSAHGCNPGKLHACPPAEACIAFFQHACWPLAELISSWSHD